MGRGVEVEADDNEQGQLYALGVLKKFGIAFDFDPTTPVAIVISAAPHRTRPQRGWLTSVEALTEFGKKCARSVRLIKAAFHCKDGRATSSPRSTSCQAPLQGRSFARLRALARRCASRSCRPLRAVPTTPGQHRRVQDLTLERDLELAGEAEGPEACQPSCPSLDMIEVGASRCALPRSRHCWPVVPCPAKLVEADRGRKWASRAEAEACSSPSASRRKRCSATCR